MKKIITVCIILLFLFGGIKLVNAETLYNTSNKNINVETLSITSKDENKETKKISEDRKSEKENQKSIKINFILICVSGVVVFVTIGGMIYYLKKKYLI